jgi:protocatechuate 3,4-dioxygenase beta subunit
LAIDNFKIKIYKMNRNKFVSMFGFSFFGTIFFSSKEGQFTQAHNACNDPVTPAVPEGPFYKDEKLNRIDITENKKGVPVQYVFLVENKNCQPIPGAVVDIWQCDADGHYSDFKVENTVNETWLRGYQATGQDGICKFTAVFPGWYTGRITHLHGKVHINGATVLTTNFFFPKEVENEVYASALYPKGPNPISILQDYELKVDKDTIRHDTLVMDVTKNSNGGLTASYKISIT